MDPSPPTLRFAIVLLSLLLSLGFFGALGGVVFLSSATSPPLSTPPPPPPLPPPLSTEVRRRRSGSGKGAGKGIKGSKGTGKAMGASLAALRARYPDESKAVGIAPVRVKKLGKNATRMGRHARKGAKAKPIE